MKLSEIRSAIRKMKGNPSITVELTPGVPMTLILQKTPTLETLGLTYDGVSGDIGLTISDDGVISGPLSPNLEVLPDLADDVLAKGEDYVPLDDEEDML